MPRVPGIGSQSTSTLSSIRLVLKINECKYYRYTTAYQYYGCKITLRDFLENTKCSTIAVNYKIGEGNVMWKTVMWNRKDKLRMKQKSSPNLTSAFLMTLSKIYTCNPFPEPEHFGWLKHGSVPHIWWINASIFYLIRAVKYRLKWAIWNGFSCAQRFIFPCYKWHLNGIADYHPITNQGWCNQFCIVNCRYEQCF